LPSANALGLGDGRSGLLPHPICSTYGEHFSGAELCTRERKDILWTTTQKMNCKKRFDQSLHSSASLKRHSRNWRRERGNIPCCGTTSKHYTFALMDQGPHDKNNFTRDDLEEALRALASMISKTDKTKAKFTAGTSQHTLQRNRLEALQMAEARIKAELNKG
jgi:hypothetical protein